MLIGASLTESPINRPDQVPLCIPSTFQLSNYTVNHWATLAHLSLHKQMTKGYVIEGVYDIYMKKGGGYERDYLHTHSGALIICRICIDPRALSILLYAVTAVHPNSHIHVQLRHSSPIACFSSDYERRKPLPSSMIDLSPLFICCFPSLPSSHARPPINTRYATTCRVQRLH